MRYYSFSIEDYRKHTGHLKPLEHYIYRTLLDWYYLDEKPIPVDTQWVTRRLGLGYEDESLVINVLTDFFYLKDGAYRHKQVDDAITDYRALCAKNAENGGKGGRPKRAESTEKENPMGYDSDASGNPLESLNSNIVNSNLLKDSLESKTLEHPAAARPPKSQYSDSFLYFWECYSQANSAGKKLASDKFERLLKSGVTLDAIMTGLYKHMPSFKEKIRKGEQRFIPHASTWLNQRRFEDVPPPTGPPKFQYTGDCEVEI